MPQLRGYGVSIVCDGAEVQCYDVKEEEPYTLSCYITSETGKEFSIQYSDYARKTAMRAECYMDGHCLSKKCSKSGRGLLIWGARTSPSTRAPFKFSELTLVDDDEAGTSFGSPKLGLIEVKLYRVRIERDHSRPGYSQRALPQLGPVSEKSKKGGWHQISLGDAQVSEWHPSAYKPVYLDRRDRPYATFRFTYRPRALLQAEGIMPRGVAATPDRSSRKRRYSSSPTRSHTRRRLADTQDNNNGRRQDQDAASGSNDRDIPVFALSSDEEEDTKVGIVTEGNTKSRPRVKRERGSPIRVGDAAGQVIDLTLESD